MQTDCLDGNPKQAGTGRLHSFASITGTNWLTGRKLLPIVKMFGARQVGVVLDVGSGQSPFRVFFPYAAAYIRLDRWRSAPVDVAALLPAIPLRAGSVDCILLTHVLTDLDEPRLLLEEARRVLKPNGCIFVLETTCFPPHDLPYDYYRLMSNGLVHLAHNANLTVVSIEHLGGFFTRFASLCNTFLLAPLRRKSVLRPLVNALRWVSP